jgi:hypothetical protein
MMWSLKGVGDSQLIQDGNRVVGSLVRNDSDWSVEILWSGASGDITFVGNYQSCIAFISGACAMATRMLEAAR